MKETRHANGLVLTTEVLLALLAAVALGLNFGIINQNTYLLPVLRCIDPQMLATDWLAAQTTPYHQAFAGLLCFLAQWAPLPTLSIVLNTALTALGVGLLLLALRRASEVADARAALGGAAVLVALVITWETKSVAGSYVFDSYLQPSSLATVFLLIAVVTWMRGAAWGCGMALGLGGLFHANFALLGPPAFVLAALLDRELPWRRSLPALLLPAALAFGYHLPAMLAAALGDGAAEAAKVFQAIRSPHHYDIHVFASQLVPLTIWTVVGFSALLLAPATAARRRLCVVLGGMAAIVAGGSVLAAAGIRPVIAMFPWRLAPFVLVLAQVGLVAGLTALLERPAPGRHASLMLLAAVAACVICVSWIPFAPDEHPPTPALIWVVCAPLLLVPLLAWLRPWPTLDRVPLAVWVASGLVALVAAGSVQGTYNVRHSTQFHDSVPPDERALYEWASTTSPDSIFLVPPRLENFRLQSLRAVVVDWKSTPILPGELLEWYRRMEDIADLPGVASRRKADQGYASMHSARLVALAKRYGARYAVFDAAATDAAALCRPVYANSHYFVCAVEP